MCYFQNSGTVPQSQNGKPSNIEYKQTLDKAERSNHVWIIQRHWKLWEQDTQTNKEHNTEN
jgi:hypothetical protein